MSRVRQRTSVDLPLPERPMTTKTSPGRTSNETSRTAIVEPVLLAQLGARERPRPGVPMMLARPARRSSTARGPRSSAWSSRSRADDHRAGAGEHDGSHPVDQQARHGHPRRVVTRDAVRSRTGAGCGEDCRCTGSRQDGVLVRHLRGPAVPRRPAVRRRGPRRMPGGHASGRIHAEAPLDEASSRGSRARVRGLGCPGGIRWGRRIRVALGPRGPVVHEYTVTSPAPFQRAAAGRRGGSISHGCASGSGERRRHRRRHRRQQPGLPPRPARLARHRAARQGHAARTPAARPATPPTSSS